MIIILHKLKKVFTNSVMRFVFVGYITYFIQFVNSIFVAVFLGPYYLGIWGFIMLVLQYVNQINFGISHSINALVSVNKSKTWYVTKLFGTAMLLIVGLSVVLVLLYLLEGVFDLKFGDKYHFSIYAPLVLFIAILGHFNVLLSNICRIYGKLFNIAFGQIIFPVFVSICLFFFKDESLLWALVIANFSAFLLTFLLFIYGTPIKISLVFDKRLVNKILRKGWYLFLYNTSFYLIIISTRSFVSVYYTVSEFGFFTFSFTLANALLLLLESISYLVYPKLLNRLAIYAKKEILQLLERVRDAYITTSHALAHIAILLFPLFLMFFPKYEGASASFKIIALTIVLYTNSFGYSGLIIAKNQERSLGLIAFLALCVNICFSFLLIKLFSIAYSLVMISTMITYLIYVVALTIFGRRIMGLKIDLISVLKDSFPLRLFFPYILSLIFVVYNLNSFYFILPFIFFVLLNRKSFMSILNVIKDIIINPDYVKL